MVSDGWKNLKIIAFMNAYTQGISGGDLDSLKLVRDL